MIRIKFKSTVFILCGLLIAPLLHAETLYVTDILRLGLHVAADTSDNPFRTLVSGDALEIRQRTRYYAEVRTSDGTVGWVKASYLTDERPAQSFLAELTEQRDSLSNELAGLSARLSESNSELDSLRSERDSLERDVSRTAAETASLRKDNRLLSDKMAGYKNSVPFHWLIGITLLTLVGGFVGGWWWTDAKQRKRHGGFRI